VDVLLAPLVKLAPFFLIAFGKLILASLKINQPQLIRLHFKVHLIKPRALVLILNQGQEQELVVEQVPVQEQIQELEQEQGRALTPEQAPEQVQVQELEQA
jgi:hypothetical protein